MISEYLACLEFKWLTQDESDGFDWNIIRKDNAESCILATDLEHPKDLNNLHNDNLLASEELERRESMLSNYCKEIVGKYDILVAEVKKFVPS